MAIHRLNVNDTTRRLLHLAAAKTSRPALPSSRAGNLHKGKPMADHLREQAEECRERALAYLGRPEATFLLRAAREFDRLAAAKWRVQRETVGSTDAP